jgi:signal transduction histidine kinase
VTDHGPGIAPEEQKRIFMRFARGAAGEERPEGLGLGLHIVRTLVEMHGGEVGVDSVPGHGASFWLRLPVRPDGSAEVQPSPTTPVLTTAILPLA